MNNLLFGLLTAFAQLSQRNAEIKKKGLLSLLILVGFNFTSFGQIFYKEVSINEAGVKVKQEFSCKLTVVNKIEELPNISVKVFVDSSTVSIVDNEGTEIKLDSIKIVPRMVENRSSIVYLASDALFTINWDDNRDKYSFELNSKRNDGFPTVVEFFACSVVLPEKQTDQKTK